MCIRDRSNPNRARGKNLNQKQGSNKKPSKPLVIPPKKSQQNIDSHEKPKKDNIDTKEIDGNKLDKKSTAPSAPDPSTSPPSVPLPSPAPKTTVKPIRALNDPRYKSE